jgi:hypothetical protein
LARFLDPGQPLLLWLGSWKVANPGLEGGQVAVPAFTRGSVPPRNTRIIFLYEGGHIPQMNYLLQLSFQNFGEGRLAEVPPRRGSHTLSGPG